MKHILITRPLPLALSTAKKLQQKGFIVSIISLTIIKPIAIANLQITPKTIIASSASAFIYLPNTYLPYLQQAELHFIGSNSAIAAYEYGLKQAAYIYQDTNNLVQKQPKFSEPILYICGLYRSPNIEGYLKNTKYSLLESYSTIANSKNLELLKNIQPDMALITSQYAAILLNKKAKYLPLNIKIICFSHRIAKVLTNFKNIYIADEPNEKSAITLMETL